jgi:hypothetical protein
VAERHTPRKDETPLDRGPEEFTISACLLEAVRIALQAAEPTLLLTGDIFATACVVAAVSHPEWAVAVSNRATNEIHSLAESIVNGNPIAHHFQPA